MGHGQGRDLSDHFNKSQKPFQWVKETMRDNIPLDIFKVIQQFLNKHDYRQLLNTNSNLPACKI